MVYKVFVVLLKEKEITLVYFKLLYGDYIFNGGLYLREVDRNFYIWNNYFLWKYVEVNKIFRVRYIFVLFVMGVIL